MDNRLLRDGLAEFIGTFMLAPVGAGAVTTLNMGNNPPAVVNVVVATR